MKLEVTRYGLKIVPENAQDEAYIEEVLGLRNLSDDVAKPPKRCELVRRNAIGLSRLAYIQTEVK